MGFFSLLSVLGEITILEDGVGQVQVLVEQPRLVILNPVYPSEA